MAGTTNASRTGARTAGLVLAGGAGTRYGAPKALVRGSDGVLWLQHAIAALAESGCSPVLVVVGAAAEQAEALVPLASGLETPIIFVRAPNWAEGPSASLRAGIDAAAKLVPVPQAIAVVPVDVPDLNAATVVRILGTFHGAEGVPRDSLRQAVFRGRPGHPVVIGQAHWAPLSAELAGDQGARTYLVAHQVHEMECGDLSTGRDVDVRA